MKSNEKKYLIMRKRKYMPSPVHWNIIYQTSLKTKKFSNYYFVKDHNMYCIIYGGCWFSLDVY